MVLAAEDGCSAGGRLYNGECAVTADVVEAVDCAVAVLDKEEGEVGDCEREIIARFLETAGVGEQHPSLREDCPSFQLVHCF